jgi:threonine/homoserine efflux transporter RhtA
VNGVALHTPPWGCLSALAAGTFWYQLAMVMPPRGGRQMQQRRGISVGLDVAEWFDNTI